ncbi:MAG: tannase/feruloyl esterase family alpha/beta hydrolase [Rhodospirillaceae bacterium]|nr:tannase/feruloyl esterase family alpha/beta hydrolase [Rhodospirillaceae bacterium]
MLRTFAIAAGLSLTALPAVAQDPAEACADLRNAANTLAFAQILDATTVISSTKIVAAERDIPEICRVEGYVTPTVGFLLRMPTKSWNGKFMMGGCGGPCGNFLIDRIDPALVRNYAVVTTDMGHKGPGWAWAADNLQGQMDFGYRATHVVAKAAKEIIAEFYGKAAARNYFWGCSTGGRQAMVAAQRFPEDFEGILAGAPVFDEIGDTPLFLEWNVRVNRDKDGKEILTADKLPMIHDAVMKSCDAIDGLVDGILQDPRQCKWDPAEIQCRSGRAGKDCLSKEQVEVVRKFHTGAVNSKGMQLYWGMPRGSEDQWSPIFIGRDGRPPMMGQTGTSITGFMGFWPAVGPNYSIMDYDYDRDPPRRQLTEALHTAKNPDLRPFRDAGGKLILYHGTHDNNIPYEAAVDYYETAAKVMGGEAATKEFFRFFAMPAVNHCRYGHGGGEVDWITTLENWVEKGQAPDAVIAHHMLEEPYPTLMTNNPDTQDGRYTQMARHPLPPSSYDRTRPIFAYPDVAKWDGTGDPNVAASWGKAPR